MAIHYESNWLLCRPLIINTGNLYEIQNGSKRTHLTLSRLPFHILCDIAGIPLLAWYPAVLWERLYCIYDILCVCFFSLAVYSCSFKDSSDWASSHFYNLFFVLFCENALIPHPNGSVVPLITVLSFNFCFSGLVAFLQTAVLWPRTQWTHCYYICVQKSHSWFTSCF